MTKLFPYLHRDISWLQFNYRVLQEAKDPSVPLLERIKFLAIYSSNLSEFFKVRVANHRNLVRAGKKTSKHLDFEPEKVLSQLLAMVKDQQLEFTKIYEQSIIPELEEKKIFIRQKDQLNKDQIEFIETYFKEQLQPFIQPIILLKKKVIPFLNDASIYLAFELIDKENGKVIYALMKIPSDETDRFVLLPPSNVDSREILLVDDIVRHCAKTVFPGFKIQGSFSIKLTRDGELYIDDEFSGNLITKVKKSLDKRKVGVASRLVFDREIPKKMLKYLMEVFDLHEYDLSPEGRQHNNSDFFSFPRFNLDNLQDQSLTPLPYYALENLKSVYTGIAVADHLIHVPYQSYESTIRFFEDAVNDDTITEIAVVQYRVAKKSRIMDALINAARQGKKVFVFIEIKARFDEEANLQWGEKLENEGIKVRYSIPGLKVHSKLALITQRDANGKKREYAYFSTGNFNENTARLYTDLCFFTSDPRLTSEARRLMNFLEKKQPIKDKFEHLGVGQYNLNDKIDDLINYEIKQAKQKKKAEIILKLNSIQDKKIIKKLYEASQAGVKIKMVVRGICSIVPGVKGVSENIEIISIIDRFLEHTRIYYFHHGGDKLTYMSSADWMVRNLRYRYETMIPIYDDQLKKTIREILELQLSDNVKARIISQNQTNEYKSVSTKKKNEIRSQRESYNYFKDKSEAELWI